MVSDCIANAWGDAWGDAWGQNCIYITLNTTLARKDIFNYNDNCICILVNRQLLFK